MNTPNQAPTEEPQPPHSPEPDPPTVATVLDKLRSYFQEDRRARMLVLGIGFIAVAILVWFFFVRSDELSRTNVPPDTDVQTGEEGHADEDEHGEELVVLTDAEIEEFGIEIRSSDSGTMAVEIELPGEVRANEDRYAHVTPRVSGVVRSVRASVGSFVSAGQTMAVIDSRELADLKADYLAAVERESLAQASFAREERLFGQEITSEADFLEARQALAEARIATRAARQKLVALGFSDTYIHRLPEQVERSLVTYPLSAPISGRVVEKHVVPGEAVGEATQAFEIADLSTVWVDLSVYQRDLDIVREGQEVVVDAGPELGRSRGTISYVRPVVGAETRTAIARAVIDNPDGMLRPGQFVTGHIAIDEAEVAIVVPTSAVIEVEGTPSVFVQTAEGFLLHPVMVGDRSADQIEITNGLEVGERYVAVGAFALKAELGKSEMDSGHAH